MTTKGFVSALLGALCAATFMAPAARAAHQIPDDTIGVVGCLLSGLYGTNWVDSVEKDLALQPPPAPNDGGAPGWLLDTDSSVFSFGGTAMCGAVDVASRQPYTAAGGWAVGAGNAFTFTAGGTSDHLVCGTGTVNGTANIQGPANLLAGGSLADGHQFPDRHTDVDASFAITLAERVGVLSFVVSPGVDGTGGNRVGNNVVTGGNGAGVVEFVATTGSCAEGPGVTQFWVNGAFATTIFGDGGVGG